jgi:hypothetical protein
MSIVSWNCRGLGNLWTVQKLHRLVKEKKPNIVFLMETKLRSNKMERVRVQLGFEHMFVVDSVGKRGGLALFWTVDAGVEIQNYSRHHINAKVCSSPAKPQWKFTSFYGHPDPSKRMEAWNLLRHIARMEPMPWVCLGDFNEILSADEKYGGRRRQRGLMENFKKTLEACGLSDLGYKGPKYTWNNGREGTEFTKERLDRVVANGSWGEMHHGLEVTIGVTLCSDHLPIIVTLSDRSSMPKRPRNFRFEASWELHAKCRDIIANSWEGTQSHAADSWVLLSSKMENCRNSLMGWQREEVEKPRRQFNEQKKRLAALYDAEIEPDAGNVVELQKDLKILMEQEDLKWRQRAKMDWLKHGDRNSKFFHACTSQRRKVNKIDQIQDECGGLWKNQEGVGRAFENYFAKLFTAGGAVNYHDSLDGLDGRITDAMNEALVRPFIAEEVRTALFQMDPLKAPGPDGFNAGFFQKHWEIVGLEVCKAVLYSLNNATLDSVLNSTFITLIPKMSSPTSVTEFRQISLCNVLYKIISKVLANQLKVILPNIISPYQSAFIPGRLITDNILAAYETLHMMHMRRGKKGYMTVKIDMNKAYDRVEWCFLEAVMGKMGFAPSWIKLIMMCVTSAHYAVLVNGIPMGKIIPTRGIRQGDPISPYLFLICAEVLSLSLIKADREAGRVFWRGFLLRKGVLG